MLSIKKRNTLKHFGFFKIERAYSMAKSIKKPSKIQWVFQAFQRAEFIFLETRVCWNVMTWSLHSILKATLFENDAWFDGKLVGCNAAIQYAIDFVLDLSEQCSMNSHISMASCECNGE